MAEVPDRDEMVRNFVTMSGASEELVSVILGVDLSCCLEARQFLLIGTGHPVPRNKRLGYAGRLQLLLPRRG